jgi:hypothetical protein
MKASESGSILVIVCLLLFLVLTFTMVLADQAVKDSGRQREAGNVLKSVYEGVVGDTAQDEFGYLGDVGDYPASLTDLVNDPGLIGWNGPYIHNVPVANGMLYDPYGSPLEYFFDLSTTALDQLTVISRGMDHESTNGAANPNVDSEFSGILPNAGGYGAANPDNQVYPDFLTDLDSLSREAVGTLTYDIQNFNQHSLSNAMVAGCPGLYSLNITSVPRGAADTTTLAYPSTLYAQSLEAQLLQGIYDLEITSQGAQGSEWRERVAILPGATLRKSVIAHRIDSSTTPNTGYTLTIFNNATQTFALRVFGSSQGNVSTGTPIRQFTVRPCSLITATQGSTVWDTFIMPYENFTRVVKAPPQTSYTLTVTNGGTNSDVVKVVHTGHPGYPGMGMVLGTVYKRKTRTFTIPGTINQNIPVANRGVLIEYRTRDNTLISSATYTGSQVVSVP